MARSNHRPVADLVKMYGPAPTTKSSFLNSNRTNSDVPAWKLELQKRKDEAGTRSSISSQNSSISSSGSGSWMREEKRDSEAPNEPAWKNEPHKPRQNFSAGNAAQVRKPWQPPVPPTSHAPAKDPPWNPSAISSPPPWKKPPSNESGKPQVGAKPVPNDKPWMKPKPPTDSKPTFPKPEPATKVEPAWKKPTFSPKPGANSDNLPPPWKSQSSPATNPPPWKPQSSPATNPPPWKQGSSFSQTQKTSLHSMNGINATASDREVLPPPPPADDIYDDNNDIIAPPDPPEPIAPPRRDRPSFLHRPPTPTKTAPPGPPRRKPLPSDIISRRPPAKPVKPPNVRLPGRSESPAFPPLPSPCRNLPPVPPSDLSRKPSHSGESGTLSRRPLPTLSIPDKALPPPPPDTREPPAFPGSTSAGNPPPLPGRPGPPPSAGNPPPLPGRPGPPPSVARMLPPSPSAANDIYDDTEDVISLMPPAIPSVSGNSPPLLKQPSTDEIPTWDDEEEEAQEAVYDDTPEINGAAGEDEELYEDVETYMRRKDLTGKSSNDNAKLTKEEEKKRKEAEKKEKEMRKKFKLPKEGEIPAEMVGYVTCASRGSGKDLAVQANERIDIIRTKDCPKSKFLVRNSNGLYGYVDSENLTIDTDALKNTLCRQQPRPATQSVSFPPPLTDEPDDGAAIYDETAGDEDLYEEL